LSNAIPAHNQPHSSLPPMSMAVAQSTRLISLIMLDVSEIKGLYDIVSIARQIAHKIIAVQSTVNRLTARKLRSRKRRYPF
jgi:hypothetical protein